MADEGADRSPSLEGQVFAENTPAGYNANEGVEHMQYEYEVVDEPAANGNSMSPELPILRSNPASPDAPESFDGNYPQSPAAPVSPDYQGPQSPDAEYRESSKPPESPAYDEGQVIDDDEGMDYQSFVPGDGPRSHEEYSHSDDDGGEEGDADGDNEEDRLDRLKHLRFKKSKSNLGAPTRRTVRSFLDGKFVEDVDVTAFAARRGKSEQQDDTPPQRRERDDRTERRKKKKKHDQERVERIPPITYESRPHPYNPQSIAMKLQQLIARVDGSNIPEVFYDYGNIPEEEDITTILVEAIQLEQDVEDVYEKREMLLAEMEKMLESEKENIKKVHSDLPDHLKNVVTVEGDNIGLTEGQNLTDEKASHFPTMQSLLGNTVVQQPILPSLSANGLPSYSFPGLKNGAETPGASELGLIESPEKYMIESKIAPVSPVSESNYQQDDEANISVERGIVPSSIYDGESMSITYGWPELAAYEEREDPIESYQMPPNPGAPEAIGIHKYILKTIMSAIESKPSQVANAPTSPDMTSSSLLDTISPQKPANPPSLMSLTTKDPYGNIVAPPTNFRARRSAPQNTGRSGHADSPGI